MCNLKCHCISLFELADLYKVIKHILEYVRLSCLPRKKKHIKIKSLLLKHLKRPEGTLTSLTEVQENAKIKAECTFSLC